MSQHVLYRYFSERKWADEFLKGNILFRSLSYFRDFEDDETRNDRNEGAAIYKPVNGLGIHNQTTNQQFMLQNTSFESIANAEDIFVFCQSRSLTQEMVSRFCACISVKVHDIPEYCSRVVAALPESVNFPCTKNRPLIGHRVEYYDPKVGGDPRWALPSKIAVSKVESYSWQDEFRLVYSEKNSFDFENVQLRLVQGAAQKGKVGLPHAHRLIEVGDMRDICSTTFF